MKGDRGKRMKAALILAIALALGACGGGADDTSTALTGPAGHPVTTIPVDCGGSNRCL